jgi:putative YhdH/YhfP family quinone oxidoreductase
MRRGVADRHAELNMLPGTMRAFVVAEKSGSIQMAKETLPTNSLPPGDVVVRVRYSSLNYKDALAARGHRGVVRSLPHVPGIDAAGEVVESASPKFQPGQSVIVTSFELGADRFGAWAEFIRVPADWIVPLPGGLSLRDAMIFGTAGLTAAMCVEVFQERGLTPDAGELVVTGASGGVGTLAVGMLSRLGYSVVAVSGKPQSREFLARLGAKRVLSREEAIDSSDRPLLKAQWAGAVDTVGGAMLATIVRSTKPRGVVAACGLVGGAELPLSVYPFILRGVQLVGIESAWYPAEKRSALWKHMAIDWRPATFEDLATEVSLDELPPKIDAILHGGITGRVVVRIV